MSLHLWGCAHPVSHTGHLGGYGAVSATGSSFPHIHISQTYTVTYHLEIDIY